MQKSTVVGLLVLGGTSCICIALFFLLNDRKNKTQEAIVKIDIPHDNEDKTLNFIDSKAAEIDLDEISLKEDDSSCCSSDSFTSCTSTCSELCTPSTNLSSDSSGRHDSNQDQLLHKCARSINNTESIQAQNSLDRHLNSPVVIAYKDMDSFLQNAKTESPETEVVQCFESSSRRYSSEVVKCYRGYHDVIVPNSPETGVLINFTPKPAKNL